MPAPIVKEHKHTWVKHKQREGYFRCTGATCYSIQPRDILIGKENACPFCGKTFLLSREDLRRAKPRCQDCSQTKEAKTYQKAQEVMRNLLEGVDINKEGEDDES